MSSHTAEALQQLDAGHHFTGLDGDVLAGAGGAHPAARDGARALSGAMPIIMELKGDDPEVARRAVALVRGGRRHRPCVLRRIRGPVVRGARVQEGPTSCRVRRAEEIRWFLYRSWVAVAPRRTAFQAFQVPETAGALRVVSRASCVPRGGPECLSPSGPWTSRRRWSACWRGASAA